MILEAGPPIDEPTDEWCEEPGPQHEMDINDRPSLIERKSNHDGPGRDGKTKYSALTSKEQGKHWEQAGGSRNPNQGG